MVTLVRSQGSLFPMFFYPQVINEGLGNIMKIVVKV
jgi:hypothetical protein